MISMALGEIGEGGLLVLYLSLWRTSVAVVGIEEGRFSALEEEDFLGPFLRHLSFGGGRFSGSAEGLCLGLGG